MRIKSDAGLHFNPRPREGSDVSQKIDSAIQLSISIHAPAKGATDLAEELSLIIDISIHAPAKGATLAFF